MRFRVHLLNALYFDLLPGPGQTTETFVDIARQSIREGGVIGGPTKLDNSEHVVIPVEQIRYIEILEIPEDER